MEDLECPNCHHRTISLWRKMVLGPARAIECSNCGSRISVPYLAMLASIPFLLALVAAQLLGSLAIGAVLVITGILAMSWIHYKFVPLIVK